MRRVIGYAMLSAPFVAIFGYTIWAYNWEGALAIAVICVMALWVWIAAWLVYS